MFRLEVLRGGQPVEYSIAASPRMVVLTSGAGRVECVFETDERLRFRVQGLSLRLNAGGGGFNYCLPRGRDRWQVNLFPANRSFLLTRISGGVTVDAPWKTTFATHIHLTADGEKENAEVALEYFSTTAPQPVEFTSFDSLPGRATSDLSGFMAYLPEVPDEFHAARALAGYILWSARVKPQGRLTRDAILMSKNWMTNVWSWDNCFNAMALAADHPSLAWDQVMVICDLQDADGCLPDAVNPEFVSWNFCKPPVYGWTVMRMLQRNPVIAEKLADFYPRLVRLTDWWMRERDDDGDGMPQYNHGNDSGWDNATCFDMVPPVEGPDLASFLIVQMDALAAIAERLGLQNDCQRWQKRADRLFDVLLNHAWDGKRFIAKRSGTHEAPSKGDSLIPFMPLLLGDRLPGSIRNTLVAGLKEQGRFMTEWGPATESPRSPLYEPDGYWRGPIWAPSTYILYDGLLSCGETDMAHDIARRFCRLCAKSGMAENFDALAGAPLRDKAYTWTSSVFLMLAHDLV